jgi:hypothetical protein
LSALLGQAKGKSQGLAAREIQYDLRFEKKKKKKLDVVSYYVRKFQVTYSLGSKKKPLNVTYVFLSHRAPGQGFIESFSFFCECPRLPSCSIEDIRKEKYVQLLSHS